MSAQLVDMSDLKPLIFETLRLGPDAWYDFRSNYDLSEESIHSLYVTDPEWREHAARNKGKINFWRRDFSNLKIQHCDFTGVDFSSCRFNGTTFLNVKFTGADLRDADFAGAKFHEQIDFQGANLEGADLSKTKFSSNTKFDGANLDGTSFEAADIRRASGVRFSSTHIRGTILSPTSTNPWSVVRKRYSGTDFALNMIFVAMFCATVLAELLLLQSVTVALVESTLTERGIVECSPVPLAEIFSHLMVLEPRSSGCRAYPVWAVIFGFHKTLPALSVLLTLFLSHSTLAEVF